MREAPSYLADLLRNIGGTNPYNEPAFRLVWSPERLRPSGGVWLDWLPGTAIKDRNSAKNRPWKRTVGVRFVRRYGPLKEWALEKWVPALLYGTRERWYTPAISGGTMICVTDSEGIKYIPSQGEYPSRGDYEYAGFAFREAELSEASVIPCVQAILRHVESLPVDPARRVAMASYVANAAAQTADEMYEKWALDRIEESQPAFNGQIMSGRGPKHPHSSAEVLRKLGIKEHHIS